VFSCYNKAKWPAELIVRVPHLLALLGHDNEHLIEIRESYGKSLFNFYTEVTMIDLENQCSLIKPRKAIKEVNEIDGLMKEMRVSKFHLLVRKFDVYITVYFVLLEISKNASKLKNFCRLNMDLI
jgi:hypothetical protein